MRAVVEADSYSRLARALHNMDLVSWGYRIGRFVRRKGFGTEES
jgi:hypothetical protein